MLNTYNFQHSPSDISIKTPVFMSETGVSLIKSTDITIMFDDVALKTPDIAAMSDDSVTRSHEIETMLVDFTTISGNSESHFHLQINKLDSRITNSRITNPLFTNSPLTNSQSRTQLWQTQK